MTIEMPLGAETTPLSSSIEKYIGDLTLRDPESIVLKKIKSLDDDQITDVNNFLDKEGYTLFAFGATRDPEERSRAVELVDEILNRNSAQNTPEVIARLKKLLD